MAGTEDREYRMIRSAAAEFADRELAPLREEFDAFPYGPFFQNVLEKAFELDYFHLTLPEDLGGAGMGIRALCIVLEEISRQDASLGGVIFTNAFAQELLLSSDRSIALQGIVEGADGVNDFLIAFPVFNNPSEIRTMVRMHEENENCILSGKLEYLVIGGMARWSIIPATDENSQGYSFYIADLKDADVMKSEPILSLGLRSCFAVDVEFANLEAVPICQTGKGDDCFKKSADKMQLAVAAISAGIMKGSFMEALSYSRERDQGGRKIIDWSELQMMLAEMAVEIRIADMIISKACQAAERKEKGWEQYASAAAIHVQNAAVSATTDGVQALGGVGYMKDFGQEKRFRDAQHMQAALGLAPLKKIKLLKRMIGKEV